jgi:cobaltochelatase CobN
VPAHLFDLYFEATLGRDAVVDFMAREAPEALAAMRDLFGRLRAAGLWDTKRNSIIARLESTP